MCGLQPGERRRTTLKPRKLEEIAAEIEAIAEAKAFGVWRQMGDEWVVDPLGNRALLLEALEAAKGLMHMKSNVEAVERILAAYRGEGG